MSEPSPPNEVGTTDGIAWHLWTPDPAQFTGARPGVVVCHGAGSCKENHADFAVMAASKGWVALAFDARGHGQTEPGLDDKAVPDVVRMVELLRGRPDVDPARVIVRGSSMGGALALYGACSSMEVAGAIAVCPAPEQGLLMGLKAGAFEIRVADLPSIERWIERHALIEEISDLAGRPLLLLHAEGDEQVPIAHSRALYEAAEEPKRLIEVPGGDHRSIQHDPALQAESLDWVARQLSTDS
ncbi:MAG: alpha/beta hydrolase [bacterium]